MKATTTSGAAFAVHALAMLAAPAQAQTAPVLRDVVLGMPDAPVTIVEYASTTCSACQHFHIDVLPRLKARYIMSGEANFVLRDHPTPPVPVANAGSALARCAGAADFYAVIGDLFARQAETLAAARTGGARDQIIRIGAAHGMSSSDVQACIGNPEIKAYLDKQVEDAPGVMSTPTLYVNGRLVAEPTFAALGAAIDAELASRTPIHEVHPQK
ncbi:MAG: thioredoxin domain-containing protein [Alphaproteobacteria bacterium]|nr:thioredoxin domain-containing protein [Alphaproteobacteria bacterium]